MKRPDTNRILRALKDFQRDTVDYAFKRMYEDDPPARRFLVADEVGLGKTFVAKGIIARTIDYLWERDPDLRIDIVYICSNLSIARQNINRLNLTGDKDSELPDRITMLPRYIRNLKKRKLNFVSFTPGTSFDLRSSYGRADERALLYNLLPDNWKEDTRGVISVLTGPASRSSFLQRVEDPKNSRIDEDLRKGFHEELEHLTEAESARGMPTLFERFTNLAEQLGARENLSPDENSERAKIVGELRATLAASCLHALEPDLIILDEFQRFRDLLKGEDEASRLAMTLFNWRDARVLLLSATPYKMYTLSEESAGDDHFRDFIQTIAFLQNDSASTATLKAQLSTFKRELLQYGLDSNATLQTAKQQIENSLRRVMVRTERLAVTSDRNGMLEEIRYKPTLEPQDLRSYLALQQVARATGHGDTLEYWKSASYLLNFMDDYQLKRRFEREALGERSSMLFETFKRYPEVLLSRSDIECYHRIDPSNARLRAILADTIDSGAWSLFWLPPSLPYYRLAGRYENPEAQKLTKRLVFSSWQVVPKVISALVSHEAERRLFHASDEGHERANTQESRRRHSRLLQFSVSDGRPARMPVLAMVYPSTTLAELGDPLAVLRETKGNQLEDLLSVNEVLERIREKLSPLINQITASAARTAQPDERWYWAAPILLDLYRDKEATRKWWGLPHLARYWRGELGSAGDEDGSVDENVESHTAWAEHVDAARRLLEEGGISLGKPPADLSNVLALLALSGPAIVALRSLCSVAGGRELVTDLPIRIFAGQVGHAFLTLFNMPEITASLRQTSDEIAYWHRVLNYCAEGCLQAVIDEYAHVLVEWRGVQGKSPQEISQEVAKAMAEALSLRTAIVSADLISLDEGGSGVLIGDKVRFRSRFAARFGGQGLDEIRALQRQSELQTAFNSPFWPFVLCTTSVGQEGLDFHLYCHAVVHWNLPANPVDLEQREGRVHRFKSHAVRKNIARRYGMKLLGNATGPDLWADLFRAARSESDSDLVPYWVFPVEEGAKIERHVPFLPLSTDSDRAERLRQSLAVYRLVFGQSRQEDLVSFLLHHVPQDRVDEVARSICIDLSPEPSKNRAESGEDLAPNSLPTQELPGEKFLFAQQANLGQLRDLLDQFTALFRKEIEKHRKRMSDAQAHLIEQFTRLMDSYRRLMEARQAVLDEEARQITRMLESWKDLFNQFRSLCPKEDTVALIDQYRDLLDEFSRDSARASIVHMSHKGGA